MDALVAAAHAGKEVTVIVELRARFDEEANIELANRLQEAGAHVMYGVVGYKTHAKLTLVVRREPGGMRRYCHLGTGNYHPRTARAYTDYGLFTCDDEIGQDVHELFLQLTSLTQTPKLCCLLQSPFGLHERDAREDRSRSGARARRQPARIIAKMNALVDPQVIEALYRASRAGVQIDLIVRGVCALRPGIPGVSENIRVRSIVGRFLEHSRVFYFENGGDDGDVLRERGLDGAQLLPPRRSGVPDPGATRIATRILARPGNLSARRHAGVGAAAATACYYAACAPPKTRRSARRRSCSPATRRLDDYALIARVLSRAS